MAALVLSLAMPTAASAAPPLPAALVSPPDGGTTASVSPTLSVSASDPDGGSLEVAFEGRIAGATVPADPAAEPFALVVVPDTQNYSDGQQARLEQQLRWVRDSRDELGTAFVIQVGDLVNDWTLERGWDNISNAFAILDDANVPNTVVPGNHDFDNVTGDVGPYNAHFPPSRYAEAGWSTASTRYGGYLGQDQFGSDGIDRGNADSYALFTAGGVDYLVLNLEWEAPGYALDWADRVLDAHPDRTVIMATHSFITWRGTRLTTPQRPGGTAPAALWSDFVAQHCQIRLVVSGHEHEGDLGEANRTDDNVCGQPVHQIVTDYQGRPNGGDGWLRYYTVDPVQQTLAATTYSPTLDAFETDSDSSFTLPFEIGTRVPAPFEPIATREIASGGIATADWPNLAPGTVYEWRAVVDDGESRITSPTWSLRAPAPNVPPTASFRTDADGLTVHADASGSIDEGSIASYAWQFGDGSTATGVAASHAYAQSGSYLVQLTVTDDQGATDESVAAVTVLGPGSSILAEDAFGRSVSNGWGTADTGGEWTLRGSDVRFSVSDGAGRIQIPPSTSSTVYADLNGVSSANTRIDAVFSVDALTDAHYVSLVGRRTGSSNYIARLRMQADGGARLYLLRDSAASLAPVLQVPIAFEPGQRYVLAFEVTGSSPTAVRAKVWELGQPEPGWMREGSDGFGALQGAGAVSVFTYVPSNPAGGGVAFDRITVSDPSGVEEPPANAAPIAAFTVSADGMSVSTDASGSADEDGEIVAYAWDFGTGFVSGAATATHAFVAPGTYPIRLRVTDDDGATGTVEHVVTVLEPGSDVLAVDAFDRSVSSGWGSAEVGGPWSLRGPASRFSVADGAGRIAIPSSTSQTAYADLDGVSGSSTRVDATFSIDTQLEAQYVSVVARRVGADSYVARIRTQADGGARLYLLREWSLVGPMVQLPFDVVPGQQYRLAVEVTGASPTTVRAKVWPVAAAEPTWQSEGTDDHPALQQAGSISVFTRVPSSLAGGGVAFEHITVTDPSGSTEPLPNAAPVAAFSFATDGLTVTTDAAGSSDSDGTVASYEWDFGAGFEPGSATAVHTFATAGIYPVRLRVTDDEGVADQIEADVAVHEAGSGALATDAFERAVSNGWGSADAGGPWTLRGTASRFSVVDGAGRMTVPAARSQTLSADLDGVSSASTRVDAVFSIDTQLEAQYVSVVARRAGADSYVARIRTQSDGGARLYLLRQWSAVGPSIQLPFEIVPGQQYRIAMEATGVSPTTVRAKVWPIGQPEPAWQTEGTDDFAGLQQPGSITVFTYVQSGPSGGGVAWDEITVTDPSMGG